MSNAAIEAKQAAITPDGWRFTVTVTEGASATTHDVTLSRALLEKLTKKASVHPTPKQAIIASFRFLLQREPKESILRQFDCSVISTYFPEYEEQAPKLM